MNDDDDDVTSSSLLESALATCWENIIRVVDVKIFHTGLRATCLGHHNAQIATSG